MVRLLIFSLSLLASYVHGATIPKGLVSTSEYDGRIIGGWPISIDEVPYMAQIVYYGAQICGGSIISDDVIITAAHCLESLTERMTKVRVGTTYRFSGTLLPVRKMIAHENFTAPSQGNDVALIWLQSPLKFSNLVQKIPLPKPEAMVETGAVALVSGWGYMNLKGYMPNHLMAVEVPIIDRYECQEDYDGVINQDMICAGYPEGKKDACSGDSGGPLMIDSRLVGITSFGYLCAQPGYPGVYTNVAHFVHWIDERMQEDVESKKFVMR